MRMTQLCAASALAIASAGAASAQTSCEALDTLRLTDTVITSATERTDIEGLPDHCSVMGYIRPAIHFEIRLPLQDWNGGFYMAGCGGFCGRLLSDAGGFINAMNPGLQRGYAVATMDGGHWGTGSTDARWALDNRVAEVDWGDRAVRETAIVSEAVITAFYGAVAEPSIFQGCSTGGRQANMLAVRDPELFDGIINGAPALDYTGLVGTWMASVVQQNTAADGSQIVTPDIVPFVQDTVYAACDGLDGLEDGLISDPGACSIDWTEHTCGSDGSNMCVTEAQAETLTAWYEGGATNSAGEQLYPATVPYGSEPYWWLWLTGNADGDGRLVPAFNQNFLQFMAFQDDPGEGYTAMEFDMDADPARMALMASIYNSDDPDLSGFAEAGGVMLTWHGLADAIVPPGKTVDYYEEAAAAAGGMDALGAFNRLFLIPGVDHCGILPGPGITQGGVDLLTVMEDWLESGSAPDQIMTTRPGADSVPDRVRPVCAYPHMAAYDGSGDPNLPDSFSCTAE